MIQRNVNYVLNIRSTQIPKKTSHPYNMDHAGSCGDVKQKRVSCV